MDLSKYEIADAAQRLEILDPVTKEKTDIVIFVISPDHPDYKAKTIESFRPKPGEKTDIAAIVSRKDDLIARLITGWEKIELNGKALKYSPANAVKIVKQFPWLADQIDSFCGNRINFFKGSGKL